MKAFEEDLEDETVRAPAPAPARAIHQPKRVVSSQPAEVSMPKKQRQMDVDEIGGQPAESHYETNDLPDDHVQDEEQPVEPETKEEEKPAQNLMSNILGSANWSTAPEEEDVKMETAEAPVDLAPGVIGDSSTETKIVDFNGFDFYLTDVHEDANTASVLLFGRMRTSYSATVSCCIVVKNIYRNVFFLHTDPLESDDSTALANSMAIFKEFDDMRKSGRKPFSDIKEFKVPKQLVRRNYAFELKGVPHGLLNFFKITYPARYPPLPADLTGKSFSRIFGSHTSLTELLLVKCKIQGPSWLRVQGAVRQERRARSWCKEEFVLDFGGLKTKTFKPIFALTENVPEAPKLSILGLSVKSVATSGGSNKSSSAGSREIAAVAMCFAPSVKLESQETEIRFDGNNGRFAAVRMQEGKALPRREVDALQAQGIQVMDEKSLLAMLRAKIQQVDPDVII